MSVVNNSILLSFPADERITQPAAEPDLLSLMQALRDGELLGKVMTGLLMQGRPVHTMFGHKIEFNL